jgi:hypothetical protein
MSDWEAERNRIHSAVADAVHETSGNMLLSTLVIAVVINGEGEKQLSCWTSPDVRQWEAVGLLEYVRMDHAALLTERRITPGRPMSWPPERDIVAPVSEAEHEAVRTAQRALKLARQASWTSPPEPP